MTGSWREGQQLVDAWSYAQPPVGFTSPLEGNAVGCIRIPDMNVELPAVYWRYQ